MKRKRSSCWINDEKIWQILSDCGDAKLDDTSDFFERENRRYLDFTATSEALGVYNRVVTFLRMVTLLLIFLIMNIVILLEKRQQDRSSVIYKNIPRKQSPVPVCQPYPELLQKLEMDTLWLMILFYAGNQKQERNIRYIQMI